MKTPTELKPVSFLPEMPAANYLSFFGCHHSAGDSGWQQAMAYLILDMPQEALQVLQHSNNTPAESAELAALWLLSMEQAGMDSAIVAHTASLALQSHGWHEGVFAIGMIHYLESTQFEQALALWKKWDRKGGIPRFADHLHNHACALAGVCRWPEALNEVERAACLPYEPAAMLMDEDLAHLWAYYAQGVPSRAEAECLLRPGIARILNEARVGHIIRSIPHATFCHALPQFLRAWMRRDMSSNFILRPETPAGIRQRYYAWLDERRLQKIDLLCKAISLACDRLKPSHC